MSILNLIKYSFVGLAACNSAVTHSNEQKLTYGFSVKSGVYDIDDPDGKTESPIFFVPQLYTAYKFGRSLRVLSGFEYWKGEFSEGNNRIKQDMDGFGISGGIEKDVNIRYGLQLQLGCLLTYKELEFTNREILDHQNFLITEFNDRSYSYGALKLSSKVNWQLGERMILGVGLFTEQSEASSFTGIEIGMEL